MATGDIEEPRRSYKKLLLANQDAFEAREYVLRAAAFGERETLAQQEKVALAAFVAAFVVAYGRCFVSSRSKKNNLPSFAERFVSTLSPAEKTLHRRVRDLRDQEFAHSDADVADISVGTWNGHSLVPTSRILRLYSLGRDELASAAALVEKVIAFVTQELVLLQGALAQSGRF